MHKVRLVLSCTNSNHMPAKPSKKESQWYLESHLLVQFLRRPVISMHVHVNLLHSCCHKRSILWMVEDRPTDHGNVREVKECYSLFYQFFLLIRAHNWSCCLQCPGDELIWPRTGFQCSRIWPVPLHWCDRTEEPSPFPARPCEFSYSVWLDSRDHRSWNVWLLKE